MGSEFKPPLSARDRHVMDLKKMSRSDGENGPLQGLIVRFEASSAEVTKWYFAQDPLQESSLLLSQLPLKLPEFDFQTELTKMDIGKMITYEIGASTLLAEVFVPEAFSKGKDHWYERSTKILEDRQEKSEAGLSTKSSYEQIADYSLERASTHGPLTEDELHRLLVAAEMFTQASTTTNPDDRHVVLQSKSFGTATLEEREQIDRSYSDQIYRLIRQNTIDNPAASSESKIFGLHAEWTFQANKLEAISREYAFLPDHLQLEQEIIFYSLLKDLEQVFLDGRLLDPAVRNSDSIGSLHELVWFVDASIYLYRQQNGNTLVFPSHSFQDRPMIGKPHENRGYDMHIVNKYRKKHQFVQLKSKPHAHFQKKYHQLIQTIHEQNFLDIQWKRLRNKIDAYRTALDTGTDAAWQTAETYILHSVSTFFSEFFADETTVHERASRFYSKKEDPFSSLLDLPRNDRRALEKIARGARKKGKRNK